MDEIGDEKNHYLPIFDYLSNEILNNFPKESEQDSNESEPFNINLFSLDIINFNLAVDENDFSSIMETTDTIIGYLREFEHSGEDPDLDEEPSFDYLQFYSNCNKCLNLDCNELTVKIFFIIGLLLNLSTKISDTLVKHDIFFNMLKILVNNTSASQDMIITFLYFIRKISLTSFEGKYLMTQIGILNFFSKILQSQTNYQIYIANIKCIMDFLTWDNETIIEESSQSDPLLIKLSNIIKDILSNQFYINLDEEGQIIICSNILKIFNIFIDNNRKHDGQEACSHLLKLGIPNSFVFYLEAELPKNLKDAITYPIVSNINQLLLFGNIDLVHEFSLNLNIMIFASMCELQNPELCLQCLNVIELLIDIQPANISLLDEDDFYNEILMMIEDANFKIQMRIISIFLTTVLNASSSEILQFFANEIIVNYFLEYIDIPDFDKLSLIPDALLRINDLIPQDDPLSFEISQALDDLYVTSFE